MAVHDERSDAPEVDGMNNPLGYLRAGYAFSADVEVFVEHISSLPTKEEGCGLNVVGFTLRFTSR